MIRTAQQKFLYRKCLLKYKLLLLAQTLNDFSFVYYYRDQVILKNVISFLSLLNDSKNIFLTSILIEKFFGARVNILCCASVCYYTRFGATDGTRRPAAPEEWDLNACTHGFEGRRKSSSCCYAVSIGTYRRLHNRSQSKSKPSCGHILITRPRLLRASRIITSSQCGGVDSGARRRNCDGIQLVND